MDFEFPEISPPLFKKLFFGSFCDFFLSKIIKTPKKTPNRNPFKNKKLLNLEKTLKKSQKVTKTPKNFLT